jgi:hypothetical protein
VKNGLDLSKLGFLALLCATSALADGRFGTGFQLANPMAQINDMYAWMSPSGPMNLAMTVSPLDDGTRSFGPSVQYVFHITNYPTDRVPSPVNGLNANGTETKVVCVFTSNTSGQCWVTDANGVKAYLSGDPSSPAGITSKDGRLRLFAGRRSDPFFFNLQGFRDAVTRIKALPHFTPLSTDTDGCPRAVDAGDALGVRLLLSETPTMATSPCTPNQQDCFSSLNVMAIVLQIDKSLFIENSVDMGIHPYVSVWASTHVGQ